MDWTLPVAVGIVVIVLLLILYLTVRVVNEYARLVVFRFGRTNDRTGEWNGRSPLVSTPSADEDPRSDHLNAWSDRRNSRTDRRNSRTHRTNCATDHRPEEIIEMA